MLDSTIFNTEKTDYGQGQSLFLGQSAGLFDTVNRRFPKIWDIYKQMKQLDWDENEFSFVTCNEEFRTRPKSISQRMIRTLAWQWEADSIAARTILPVMAPFISAPELQAAWGRITDNEVVHASTYSEIVRMSFDNPNVVLQEVLQVREAMNRLETVGKVMGQVYRTSHQLALGMMSKDDPAVYDDAILFTVAMFVLERVQFMASFAVTFAIGQTGAFMPIAKAVQKICQDEYEVHAQLDREILRNELQLPQGKAAFERLKPIILKMIHEVVHSEWTWVDYLLGDGDPLVGLNAKMLKDWVSYSAGDVLAELNLKPEFSVPKTNPLKFIEKWIDISKIQAAPQEQDNGQYKVNIMSRESTGQIFEVDF
jgi:ribonucleoside-diphosphate reductase beta chain